MLIRGFVWVFALAVFVSECLSGLILVNSG